MGFVLLAALAWSWLARVRGNWSWPLAGVLLMVFAGVTVARNRDWKDDFTLAQVTLRQSPESGYLHNMMAGTWLQRGDLQRARA